MSTELIEEYVKLHEDNARSISRVFKTYRMGALTDNELQKRVDEIFYSYYLFLENKAVRLRVTEDNWDDVLSDYEKWSHGESPDSKGEKPWLVSYSGVEPTYAAPETERALFFRIIDFLELPIAHYKPIPDHVAAPFLRTMSYNDGVKWSIWSIVDDGGLVNESEPIGKTFVLKDNYGLKTHIKIEQVGKSLYVEDPEYRGVGTIEGYTSSSPVEIVIWLNKKTNEISSLNVFMYWGAMWNEHYKVYSEFPLWQEYFKETGKRSAILFDCKKAFFKKYSEKGSSSD